MTKAEKRKFRQWANGLTDDELKAKYCKAVLDTLGSEVEEMYERGYDMQDILEREKYEIDLAVMESILERLCHERGIILWE